MTVSTMAGTAKKILNLVFSYLSRNQTDQAICKAVNVMEILRKSSFPSWPCRLFLKYFYPDLRCDVFS